MTPQYVTNIITLEEVKKWKPNDRILISTQTGTGKSTFVKDILYRHCEDTGKKILLLSNRVVLQKQTKNELFKSNKLNKDVITLQTYQSMQNFCEDGTSDSMISFFEKFDYVCMDESHYPWQDSSFNRSTSLLIDFFNPTKIGVIFLFITATPQMLLKHQSSYDFVYDIPPEYGYIEKFYFYSKKQTVESIIASTPKNEKIIFFSGVTEANRISKCFSGTSFLCSVTNKENITFMEEVDWDAKKQIETEGTFENRILCTTKILDNGVNIVDKKVKHIIIDMVDPIDIIQCLGRRRINWNDPEDTICVYIRKYGGSAAYNRLREYNKALGYVDDLNRLGSADFQKKYTMRKIDPIIHNNFKINQARYKYILYLKEILEYVTTHKDGFIEIVNEKYFPTVPRKKILIAERSFSKVTLESYVISFIGNKMFKDDQKLFVDGLFGLLLSPKYKRDMRCRGLKTINAMLDEDFIPYNVVSYTDWGSKSEHRGQNYWMVKNIKDIVLAGGSHPVGHFGE
jgi:late competence protein required for DNA uptake (superfamily II DNA/RNA helicase)